MKLTKAVKRVVMSWLWHGAGFGTLVFAVGCRSGEAMPSELESRIFIVHADFDAAWDAILDAAAALELEVDHVLKERFVTRRVVKQDDVKPSGPRDPSQQAA